MGENDMLTQLKMAMAPYITYLIAAVIVLFVLVIYLWMRMPKEGITAGGDQQLEQGYFAGGRTEAFGSRSALERIAESMDQPKPQNIDVSKMLTAESLRKLANELQCSGGYHAVAPNQPYGFLRAAAGTAEGAPIDNLFRAAGQESFSGKREVLDDASLSATMIGL